MIHFYLKAINYFQPPEINQNASVRVKEASMKGHKKAESPFKNIQSLFKNTNFCPEINGK